MRSISGHVARILRQPLVHFVVAGAALFALYAVLDDAPAAPADDEIVVDAEQAERLAAGFEATWRRPPDPAELDALIDGYITEEVFVREALALGLDAGDAVIRQRLRQKMEFIAEAAAAGDGPDDATLRAYLADNAERFQLPARVTFRQVFLGAEAGDGAVAQMREALSRIPDGTGLGTPTLLPPGMEDAVPAVVDGTFGTGFFARLAAAGPGRWEGPVRSALGVHFVRVERFSGPEAPDFERLRPRLEQAWRAEQAATLREDFAEALRADYTITRPDLSELMVP